MLRRVFAAAFAVILVSECMPAVSAALPPSRIHPEKTIIRDENLVYIGADYLNPASVLFDSQEYAPDSIAE